MSSTVEGSPGLVGDASPGSDIACPLGENPCLPAQAIAEIRALCDARDRDRGLFGGLVSVANLRAILDRNGL